MDVGASDSDFNCLKIRAAQALLWGELHSPRSYTAVPEHQAVPIRTEHVPTRRRELPGHLTWPLDHAYVGVTVADFAHRPTRYDFL
jgi:hypothetical protein